MDDQTQQVERVLGAVRQSKTRDRAVSAPAQRKRIGEWADAAGAVVAKITEDLSTSGGTSVFRRKELGPWLTDPDKFATWDVLVATKLDRACRDVADYLRLRDWCESHGKRLVIINLPLLDDRTPAGRAMGTVTATFAQLEREMAKERNKERYDDFVEMGRWPGGRIPYGFRYNKETCKLEPDNGETAGILRQMVDMAIAGKSQGQIAEWLNDSGHLTVIGRQWRTDTVRRVLRAPNTAELLGEAKAAQLRAALRAHEQTRGERTNGHMLLRVAFCATCEAPLYCQIRRDRPSGGYYRCLTCHTYKRMDHLERDAEQLVLAAVGRFELMKMELVPGDDHQAEIHRIERDIEALEKITGTETVISAKLAEIKHLEDLPFTPDHYVPIPQGITVAKHWETLGRYGKGSFMRTRDIKVRAGSEGIKDIKIDGTWYDVQNGTEGIKNIRGNPQQHRPGQRAKPWPFEGHRRSARL